MSETQVNVQLTFVTSRGTWTALAAAGLLLVAGVLAAVALGATWMTTSEDGDTLEYTLTELKEGAASLEYDDLDRLGQGTIDGTGMVAAAHVLAIIGTVFAFLAMAALAVSVVVRRARLTLVGSILAGLTAILLILSVILAPLGISAIHGDLMERSESSASLDWAAGLVLGIIMAVFAVAAAVLGAVSLRDPNMS